MMLPLPDMSHDRAWPLASLGLAVAITLVSLVAWLSPELAGALSLYRGEGFGVFQLLSAGFVHSGVSHLLGNLLMLVAIGAPVEERLGRRAYVGLFLATVVAGNVGWLALGSGVSVVGASGGVSGVMAAFFWLCPWEKVRLAVWIPSLLVLPCALLGVLLGGGVGAFALAGGLWVLSLVGWLIYGLKSFPREAPPEGRLLRGLGFRSFAIAGAWLVLLSFAPDVFMAVSGLSALTNVAVFAHLSGGVAGYGLAALLGANVGMTAREQKELEARRETQRLRRRQPEGRGVLEAGPLAKRATARKAPREESFDSWLLRTEAEVAERKRRQGAARNAEPTQRLGARERPTRTRASEPTRSRADSSGPRPQPVARPLRSQGTWKLHEGRAG